MVDNGSLHGTGVHAHVEDGKVCLWACEDHGEDDVKLTPDDAVRVAVELAKLSIIARGNKNESTDAPGHMA